jgi:hypothetical protein
MVAMQQPFLVGDLQAICWPVRSAAKNAQQFAIVAKRELGVCLKVCRNANTTGL